MRYIALIIGLLFVYLVWRPPVKELTPEQKVAGTYEARISGHEVRIRFVERGVCVVYINDEKEEEQYEKMGNTFSSIQIFLNIIYVILFLLVLFYINTFYF